MGNQNKKIESADTIHSEIDRCRVLHERNNILFSFAEHINYKNNTFAPTLWVGHDKPKQKP